MCTELCTRLWFSLPHRAVTSHCRELRHGTNAAEDQFGEGGCDLAVHFQVGLHVLPHCEATSECPIRSLSAVESIFAFRPALA
jgi:hypothetical protein